MRLVDIDGLERLRLTTLTVLGRHPGVFNRVAAFGDSSQTLVSSGTDLCVEAPPRSANSFFVVGFRAANPDAQIAHHHHVPAQVLTAIRLRVPLVTILRNPLDSALAKAAPMNKEFLIGTTLHRFLAFWETLSPVLAQASPVLFEQVVADPRGIIDRINEKFGREFSRNFPSTEEVFTSISTSRRASSSGDAGASPSPNVPNPWIAERENVLRPLAEKHPLALPALDLYGRLKKEIARL